MAWVKFHEELCAGAKRGLPRAVRFVFMELCLRARPGRGSMALPVGMSDLDGLHDVLGGSRKEVADALKILTGGDEPMVVLDGVERARTLRIPSWAAWNSGQEQSGASTARSRRHREKPPVVEFEPSVLNENDGLDSMQRPLHADATMTQLGRNDGATPYREEKRREEKISHTHTGARVADFEPDSARFAETGFSRDDLAAMLREIPPLAPLADDATVVDEVFQGYRFMCGSAATEALARGAIGALHTKERLAEMTLAQRRERVGTYLKNARQHERPSAGGDAAVSLSPDTRATLVVFADLWSKRKGVAFTDVPGDEKPASVIAVAAREHATRLKIRPGDIVRHWTERYLDDAHPFVADQNHPLRLLPSRLNEYGLPRSPGGPPTPRKPASAQREAFAPPPLDLVEQLAKATTVARPT